jgi:hypothetical protein
LQTNEQPFYITPAHQNCESLIISAVLYDPTAQLQRLFSAAFQNGGDPICAYSQGNGEYVLYVFGSSQYSHPPWGRYMTFLGNIRAV